MGHINGEESIFALSVLLARREGFYFALFAFLFRSPYWKYQQPSPAGLVVGIIKEGQEAGRIIACGCHSTQYSHNNRSGRTGTTSPERSS